MLIRMGARLGAAGCLFVLTAGFMCCGNGGSHEELVVSDNPVEGTLDWVDSFGRPAEIVAEVEHDGGPDLGLALRTMDGSRLGLLSLTLPEEEGAGVFTLADLGARFCACDRRYGGCGDGGCEPAMGTVTIDRFDRRHCKTLDYSGERICAMDLSMTIELSAPEPGDLPGTGTLSVDVFSRFWHVDDEEECL